MTAGWDEGEHEGCGKDTERAVREQDMYDLRKLEMALAQRDALVKALERIARGPFTGASTIARDALRDVVGIPGSRDK